MPMTGRRGTSSSPVPGGTDTSPKRQRGRSRIPRWRFGLVSVGPQAACDLPALGRLPRHLGVVAVRRVDDVEVRLLDVVLVTALVVALQAGQFGLQLRREEGDEELRRR